MQLYQKALKDVIEVSPSRHPTEGEILLLATKDCCTDNENLTIVLNFTYVLRALFPKFVEIRI